MKIKHDPDAMFAAEAHDTVELAKSALDPFPGRQIIFKMTVIKREADYVETLPRNVRDVSLRDEGLIVRIKEGGV
jgi:hypothetical protein